MILSAKLHTLHVFDMEVSDAAFEHVAHSYDLKTFVEASKSGKDFETHPYFKVHARSQILQLWGKGTQGDGWIKPEAGSYINTAGGETAYRISDFSASLHAKATQFGTASEADAVGTFYSNLNKSVTRARASGKPVILTGWNAGFDLSGLEAATYRHESLKPWRGYLAKEASNLKSKLLLADGADNFFSAAWKYGEHNPAFAKRYFAGVKNAKGLRSISGWGIENVANAMGGATEIMPGFEPHLAHWDAKLTAKVTQKFADLHENLAKGKNFDQAMGTAGILKPGGSASEFFSTVFAKARQTEPVITEETESIVSAVAAPKGVHFAIKAGLAFAGIIAAQLAFSTRRSRQTQITGMAETGMAADRRHKTTDFGSGYRGLDDEHHSSVSLHTALTLTTGAGLYAGHRYLLRNRPEYAQKIHNFAIQAETRSPHGQLRTFRLSEALSSHTVNEVKYSYEQLVRNGSLTRLGSTLHRISGGKINPLAAVGGLHFTNSNTSPGYLRLVGVEQGPQNIQIRFTSGGSKGSTMAGAAQRRGAVLADPGHRRKRAYDYRFSDTPDRKTDETWWEFHRRKQNPTRANLRAMEDDVRGFTTDFHPTFAKIGTIEHGFAGALNRAKSAYRNASTVGFEMGERFQHLMAQMGLGLKQGSYNKFAHVPFAGEGGMVNEMLLKRVLPAYGLFLGAKFVDHLLGHKPSQFLASLPIKVRVAHAELTDRTPGARALTDKYTNAVPGGQFGALAAPIGGAFIGGMWHYSKVLRGIDHKDLPTLKSMAWGEKFPGFMHEMPKPAVWGALVGLALASPFIPGMLGDRKTADERRRIYSGEQLVAVRQGRFWEMGPTEWKGGRIKYFRQHWFASMKAHAEDASLYGSEKEKWAHNPFLHPFKYFRDPYYLEKKHYEDRPYPITSPAFSDVPLVGPLLAATIGKFIKPVVRMHTEEWQAGDDYSLFGARLDPRSKELGLAAPTPKDEFSSPSHILHKEIHIVADLVGMPGFIAKSLHERFFPHHDLGKETFLEGSRNMTSASRRYYEKEFGAMAGPNPSGNEMEPYGYSEAIRRFIQPEHELKKVNPLRNKMPSWIPGSDYMQNFHQGDPYASIAEGFARLPGEGYAALHPELKGLNAEDYPTMDKFKILADIAPYSKQFSKYRDIVRGLSDQSSVTRIEYERTMDQVRQVKESGIPIKKRRFTAKTETFKGTIKSANEYGVMLNEMPGRRFTYSSIGTGAADLAALSLNENHHLTPETAGRDVDERHARLRQFVGKELSVGTSVKLTVAAGVGEHATAAQAVVEANGHNINRSMIQRGLALERPENGGAESTAMYGHVSKLLGAYGEGLSFTGDEGALNPLRYLPQPYNAKMWQSKTSVSQYEQREIYGSSMRRWHRPIHDFIEPYMRGSVRRFTGKRILPQENQFKRDLNTLADTLKYLRGVQDGYTNESRRTSLGANLFAPPELLSSSLSDHENSYFRSFLGETDNHTRKKILEDTSPELSRALSAQWIAKDSEVARANGKTVPTLGEGGRAFTAAGLDEYKKSKSQLDYGDFQRSKETAEFFKRTGFRMPDAGSAAYSQDADYQDVKAKIIENEGYELHDFNIFDDRASQLWRKPYLDGTARELTAGDSRSTEALRHAVEQMMVNGREKSPQVRASKSNSQSQETSVKVTIDVNEQRKILKDARRNPKKYRDAVNPAA